MPDRPLTYHLLSPKAVRSVPFVEGEWNWGITYLAEWGGGVALRDGLSQGLAGEEMHQICIFFGDVRTPSVF